MSVAISPSRHHSLRPICSAADWLRLTAGLVVAYSLFELAARWLGSDRGQYGIPIALIVIASLVLVERALWNEPLTEGARALGLGRPTASALVGALVVCVLLTLVTLVYLAAANRTVSMYPSWIGLLPGLFAQAGIAEETLFRGYLFRRVRVGRTFWRAACVATLPFVFVHLSMLAAMPLIVAVGGIILAAMLSFPLALLFERGGDTIWGPAIVHAFVQGVVKIVVMAEVTPVFPLVWMAASATLPFVVFLLPWKPRHG